jgi:hypothetical protein
MYKTGVGAVNGDSTDFLVGISGNPDVGFFLQKGERENQASLEVFGFQGTQGRVDPVSIAVRTEPLCRGMNRVEAWMKLRRWRKWQLTAMRASEATKRRK